MISIKRGLDLPIAGEPEQSIETGPEVRRVALVGDDYLGMKPTMAVREGDRVKLGQLLFEDKRRPGVRFTSPGCGTVIAVHRGAKRRFLSVEIELEGDDFETFRSFQAHNFAALERDEVREHLLHSGLWTSLRTRPYSAVPAPDVAPHSIFVTAIDTNPLAAQPELVIRQNEGDFARGLQVLTCLTDGTVFVCKRAGVELPVGEVKRVSEVEFEGPHPAGLAGTHIHFLDPIGPGKSVWHLNYQDVIAIGHLFFTGELSVDRVVSLAGPPVERPRLLKTRVGASLWDLTRGEVPNENVRIVSGSVLAGRRAVDPAAFLGRYHLQVSALVEGTERDLLGWQRPGLDKFSSIPAFASALLRRGQKFPLTTSTEGSRRPMLPIGTYENVMPLDILPTYLLRALATRDTEQAQALGALELDEEDLGLCTYVCPSKIDWGPLLRQNLTSIEEEG